MGAEDLDEVLAVERAASQAPWVRQIFEEELTREWAHVALLRAAGGRGAILAFVNYWLVRDEVHVLNVATHPAERRRGHAARLIEHVLAFAQRRRCRYVTLEVRRSNQSAIRLYRKYGFRPVGIRPSYYADNGEDALVMLLELPERA